MAVRSGGGYCCSFPERFECNKIEGTRREAYVAAALADAGHKVYAATDETACDFLVNELRLEVGGKTKRAKAADVVIRDAVDVPSGNVMPMWMPGLGY